MSVLSRRAALATIGAGLGLGAAACAGFRVGSVRPVPDDVVLCTVWAGEAEKAAFQALADGFRAATGVQVAIQLVPFSQQVRDLYTLPVGLAFLQGQYATDYPALMSGALLSSLPVLVLFVVAQRSFVTGLARTGMK